MKEMLVGRWRFNVGEPRTVPQEVIEGLEDFINKRWLTVALQLGIAGGWSKQLGYPTLVVRVDMPPITSLGEVLPVYEFEARPGGFGVLLSLAVHEELDNLINLWGIAFHASGCQGFVHLDSGNEDDPVAAGILKIPFIELQNPLVDLPTGGPYWIRTNLVDGEVVQMLEKISLCPLKTKGLKLDLVELNLAQLYKGEENLPWEASFVVKPLQGKYCKGVEIYLPPDVRKILGDPQGIATRTRIMRILAEAQKGKQYIVQPFFPPAKEGENFTIWRLFFIWWFGKYKFAGGLWNLRPRTLRIHGALDSTFGLLLASKEKT